MDAECVRQAHEKYSETFEDVFSYRKGSKKLVLKKDSAIAHRYWELEGLQDMDNEDENEKEED